MKFLFPFLKMGLTTVNFSHDGNIHEAKAWLQILDNKELIVFAHAFNIFVGILSYRKALGHVKDFIIL
jgi:hypothetical protein